MNFFTTYNAYLRDNPQHYWFKRKLYGLGWTPVRWQGWVTVVFFVGLSIVDYYRLASVYAGTDLLMRYTPQLGVFVAVLIGICYATGESPRWQWGVPTNNDHA